ncbi:multi-sensor signal transduction histidine kinase [Methylorubrum populi BJ001]|jgi:PAS domain S-box-containing protein|uniref:histidine kinase n=1 Tax=Methylorubrum populi (strain ATCC BAA-705 / NCIMB 13946 / BJ001) TaxID=441620 RepID=B1ZBV0_METPB|nr:MHYT domain-containing protein [Methylorubrum populi]ACB83508.1 multi-sensor signal transduction histidine kinase [Methylorubrum populi BJ001]OAH39342.1 histidine kinase [Methylorubrum populi]PZP71720.1 MAG: PAS domain S-box protein [Methylorubrum populi]
MVHTGYNPALVALSLAIAVLASYTALDLGGRVRGTTSRLRWAWLLGSALAMGGGIWSMHFVGMLAFEMGLPAAYDVGHTLLSLVIAIGVTGAALAWLGRSRAGRWDVLIAGPVMGIGVAAMHYTGMAAMRMPGHLAYSLPVVALSVGIAVTAATVALWLTFRPTSIWQRFAAALIMGVAVAGMHYTGMAAATITAEEAGAHSAHFAATSVDQQNLALYVAGITFVILFLAMLASAFDQQRIQGELQASEERFRAAVQAVRGVLWTNDPQGRMTGEQPGWAALTGQSRAEYEGFGWAEAVHPDDRQASIETWNATVAARSTFVHEHRVRARDGLWRHFSIRAIPVLDAQGAIREWVGVHTDITDQREAEAELRESNEEIQRYAYIVSHDLRAPLVNVMGFTSELEAVRQELTTLLRDHPQGARIDDDITEALSFIQAAIVKMERLIAAILKLSREGRRQFIPETIAMTPLIRGIADAQRHQADRKGATVRVAADLPAIIADRLAIEQIFGNLIDNALKYLDPARPGRVEVTAAPAPGDRIRFAVSDNGRGIAPQDHGRIFELFRRSGAQDQPGEGIGLASVKTLVRALGGRIEVSSQPGTGTTFVVTLPREPVTGRGEAAKSHPPETMPLAAE